MKCGTFFMILLNELYLNKILGTKIKFTTLYHCYTILEAPPTYFIYNINTIRGK